MTNTPVRRTVRFSPAANPPQPAPAIPPPFAPAPAALAPFLSGLNKSNVYITHIDRHPSFFKRRIFLVPVALNLAILLLLLWRAYAITPWYASIVASSLGYANESTVLVTQRTWRELTWIVVKRAGVFLLDSVLVRVVWPWPVSFFLERPDSPVSWRLKTGFRESEVVVRASRGWGAQELVSGQKRGEDSPFFKVRILPAIERTWMRKTGYLMMGKDWDLDFAGMVRAMGLVDEGVVEMQRLEKSVFVWVGREEGEERGEEGEWAAWEVYKLDEGADEEGRRKIVEFKDRLSAMGKESLFFRWIEIVQFESSQPGGFTSERQVRAVDQARQAFKEQGMDFEEFVKSVGGMDAMPGAGAAG